MTEYQPVLSAVAKLGERYREKQRLSGENFNIFRILNLTSDELKHSTFIAELFDPKGSHGQGPLFLKLFVEKLGITPFNVETAQVDVEKSIGRVSKEDGGRLDIHISDRRGNAIVIENKIYADDRPQQLFRYWNFNPQNVFYLTLYGKEATSLSTKFDKIKLESGRDYQLISYQSDILEWLEKCKEEVEQLPLLREGISHYINLIKHLTGQSTNKAMKEEIKKIVAYDEQNLRAVTDLANNYKLIKHQVQWNFWKALKEALEQKGITISNRKEETVTSTKTWQYYDKNKRDYGYWVEVLSFDDLRISWVCEIGSEISTGFTVEKGTTKGISDREEFRVFREIVKKCDADYQSSKCWLGQKRTRTTLDFRAFNSDAIFGLANEAKLATIVADIADTAFDEISFVKAEVEKIYQPV